MSDLIDVIERKRKTWTAKAVVSFFKSLTLASECDLDLLA